MMVSRQRLPRREFAEEVENSEEIEAELPAAYFPNRGGEVDPRLTVRVGLSRNRGMAVGFALSLAVQWWLGLPERGSGDERFAER
jgi:hypothetical protein